jgi:hypothetical protein
LLEMPRREFWSKYKGVFTNDDSTPATCEQVIDWFYQKLGEGYQVLPLGECDHFDKIKGCLGHERESDEKDVNARS